MSGKTRGYAYDVDAWVQFHLLRLASFHSETTKADLAVLAEIIQRYWGKYGNGWVTHEKLGAMAGVSKATVIRAKRNLERLGFVTVVQAGRRGSATVYLPNFGLVPPKGSKDDTETLGVKDATETEAIGIIDATETPEYRVMDDTPSYLQDRPTRAGSQIDRVDCASPTAPLADGLEASAARTAQDGFERLWKAYSHRQRKADARAAFDKLAPSTELIQHMVKSAEAWFAAWSAQNKPDAPRFSLKSWIEREEFECEPPTAYKAKERMPKVAHQEQAPKATMVGTINPFCEFGTFNDAEIIDLKFRDEIGEQIVRLEIEWNGGQSGTWHEFTFRAADAEKQRQGKAMVASIARAVGVQVDNNKDDLWKLAYEPFRCTTGPGKGMLVIRYDPPFANDNLEHAA